MQEITEQSIANIKFELPVEKAKSRRNSLLKQLYALYTSQPEINKAENRKRYHAYVRLHYPAVCKKVGFSKILYDSHKDSFKSALLPKDQKYIKYIPENRFWFFFSHVDIDGLEKLISEARDMLHRYESANWTDKQKYVVSRFIMSSVKYVDKTVDDK